MIKHALRVLKLSLALSLALGLALLVGACSESPLPPEARPLLVTMTDFRHYGVSDAPADFKETALRTRYWDSSLEFELEIESEDHADPYIYSSTMVSLERTERDAKTTYSVQKTVIPLTMKAFDLDIETRNDLFEWGDQSYFGILVHQESDFPVGNFLVVRDGRRVFFFILSGLYFDTGEDFGELVLPKLEAMRSFSS